MHFLNVGMNDTFYLGSNFQGWIESQGGDQHDLGEGRGERVRSGTERTPAQTNPHGCSVLVNI